jgi:hypothetical protein
MIGKYYESDYEEALIQLLEEYHNRRAKPAGILYQSVIDANSTSKYRLNSVGEQFLKFGLCEDIQLQDKYITSVNAAIEWHDIEKVTKD